MYRLLAVLAVLLILSGVILIAVPRETAPQSASVGPRSVAPGGTGVAQSTSAASSYLTTARSIAEQANAPLSILMGLVSLYYTRRTYINSKRLADGKPQG